MKKEKLTPETNTPKEKTFVNLIAGARPRRPYRRISPQRRLKNMPLASIFGLKNRVGIDRFPVHNCPRVHRPGGPGC